MNVANDYNFKNKLSKTYHVRTQIKILVVIVIVFSSLIKEIIAN